MQSTGRQVATTEDYWRAIILFGRNVASYKFALAKALLESGSVAGELVKLETLALPFATQICEHLRLEDKQATSSSSAFLDGCRKFNQGEITESDLVALTVARGFNNVIDAFHVVNRADVPQRFFIDERVAHRGIRLTDEFGGLSSGTIARDLPLEVEARWRLVETAWRLGMNRDMVVSHDQGDEMLLLPDRLLQRKPVTSSRAALNGYQRGACFYCGAAISLTDPGQMPDVDHFFPHVLKGRGIGPVVDGVWNLVLTCQACNRGAKGKFERLPSLRLLERLHARNEHLIVSHHPLRETLISQTGLDEVRRRAFLRGIHDRALITLIHTWEPVASSVHETLPVLC